MTHNLRRNAGDTIVEVMIAIVILSSVLGTSLAIATKSQRQTQANHEFYQAQLYANQQAEYILAAYSQALTDGSSRTAFLDGHSTTTPFCYSNPNTQVVANDSSCTKTDAARFKVSVLKSYFDGTATPAQTPLNARFVIIVVWDSLTGSATDEVELVYAL